jgi:RNA polymerase sigma factor (sigma-70 family)
VAERQAHADRIDKITYWFIENRSTLRRYARFVVDTEDDAEDLIQEAYLLLLGSNIDLEKIRSPSTYILGMVRYLSYNQARRRNRSVWLADPTVLPYLPDPDIPEERITTAWMIHDLMSSRSMDEQKVIKMLIGAYNPRDIATYLNIPIHMVQRIRSQLRERAWKYLGHHDGFPAATARGKVASTKVTETGEIVGLQPGTSDRDPHIAALRREIAQIRARAGLTVREIAKRTSPEISYATVHRALRCAPAIPRWDVLHSVARAIQATEAEIVLLQTLHRRCA